MEMQGKRM